MTFKQTSILVLAIACAGCVAGEKLGVEKETLVPAPPPSWPQGVPAGSRMVQQIDVAAVPVDSAIAAKRAISFAGGASAAARSVRRVLVGEAKSLMGSVAENIPIEDEAYLVELAGFGGVLAERTDRKKFSGMIVLVRKQDGKILRASATR